MAEQRAVRATAAGAAATGAVLNSEPCELPPLEPWLNNEPCLLPPLEPPPLEPWLNSEPCELPPLEPWLNNEPCELPPLEPPPLEPWLNNPANKLWPPPPLEPCELPPLEPPELPPPLEPQEFAKAEPGPAKMKTKAPSDAPANVDQQSSSSEFLTCCKLLLEKMTLEHARGCLLMPMIDFSEPYPPFTDLVSTARSSRIRPEREFLALGRRHAA